MGEHILILWRAVWQFRLVKSPIEKGGIRAKSCPSTQAEGRSGVPELTHCLGPASFRAGPHQGPWAGPVGWGIRTQAHGTHNAPLFPTEEVILHQGGKVFVGEMVGISTDGLLMLYCSNTYFSGIIPYFQVAYLMRFF